MYINKQSPQLEAKVSLNYANLKAMNLIKDSSTLSLNAKISIRELKKSGLIGTFVFDDILLPRQFRFQIPSLTSSEK